MRQSSKKHISRDKSRTSKSRPVRTSKSRTVRTAKSRTVRKIVQEKLPLPLAATSEDVEKTMPPPKEISTPAKETPQKDFDKKELQPEKSISQLIDKLVKQTELDEQEMPADIFEIEETQPKETATTEDEDIKPDHERETSNREIKPKAAGAATLNLKRCMYKVVEEVATELAMEVTRDDGDDWDVFWSDSSVTTNMSKTMDLHQRINHFGGLANLESKAFLAYHLNRMRAEFQEEYSFYPRSWSLPSQQEMCALYIKEHPEEVFIIKPSRGAEGKGIKIFTNTQEVTGYIPESVCQRYHSDLLLMDGFKFDLRVYVLITCIDPLRIFVYNEGLVRLATCQYKTPHSTNLDNQYMHLTNYSINKSSENYDKSESGSKRDFETFNSWLRTQNLNPDILWRDIDDVVVKTVISVHPILKQKYEDLFPTHYNHNMSACFELLGFDIMIDENVKPILLEVNRSPSFKIAGAVDERVKRKLIYDTFRILNLRQSRPCTRIDFERYLLPPGLLNPEEALRETQRRVREQLQKAREEEREREQENFREKRAKNNQPDQRMDKNLLPSREKSAPRSSPKGKKSRSSSRHEECRDKPKSVTIKDQIKWEAKNMGNYRLIYPTGESYKYTKFIHFIFTVVPGERKKEKRTR